MVVVLGEEAVIALVVVVLVCAIFGSWSEAGGLQPEFLLISG